MTAQPIDAYLDDLKRAAHAASTAEETFRNEATRRFKALERERAFAFRRYNLIQSVATAIADAKDEAEAIALGSATLLREVNWTGASKAQREVAERFQPVVVALAGVASGANGAEAAAAELQAFERWFQENRNEPFLNLMEPEVEELPLVEF